MTALARLEKGYPGKCAPVRAGPVTDRRAALVASRVLPPRSAALAENTALPDAPIALRLHMKHRAEMGYLWLARMEGSNGRTTHIRRYAVIEDHQAVPALCRQIHRVIAPATSGGGE